MEHGVSAGSVSDDEPQEVPDDEREYFLGRNQGQAKNGTNDKPRIFPTMIIDNPVW
jgi:hypothetical protein